MSSTLEPFVPSHPVAQQLAAAPFSALLGGAGTGKSTLVREWYESASLGTLALTSSTGIAAVNLGNGTTVNALLRYFDTQSLVDLYTTGALHSRLRKLRRAGLRRILLDEISMTPADQLTVLVRAVEEVNGGGYDPTEVDEEDADAPPLGLTVIGDFCQLAPIKAAYAFESPEWHQFAITKLDRVWRQDDPSFIEALRAVRRGEGAAAVEVLTPCFQKTTDPHFDGPTLLAKNDAVERYNRLRLDHLHSLQHSFPSVRWGQQRSEWKQIPEVLELKEGALVMLLANCYDPEINGYRYVNGDLGEFKGLEHGKPIVTIRRTGIEEEIAFVDREVTEPLEVGERKALKAEGKADLIREKQKIVGAIRYLPLRVAYATSIHKSQSLSFDAVQINLREPFTGAPAMTYVALSRARTLGGLRIVGDARTFVARCSVDARVREWV